MKKMSFIFSAALAIVAIGLAVFAAEGSSSPYTDAAGDIGSGINTAGGTLDILGMEVTSTASDITFKLTVNGNTTSVDWGKFMIGIATGKTDGTYDSNGWNRRAPLPTPVPDPPPPQPSIINLSNDNDPFAPNLTGMNYWIGAWVNGSSAQAAVGGSEVYSYDNGASSWTRLGATWDAGTYPYAYTVTAGAQSNIEWTFPLSLLNLSVGDTILFDAYSSGGGDNDGAIDALANPNVSVAGWNDAYTSYLTSAGGPGLNSYTVVPIPEPATIAMAAGAALGGVVMMRRRRRAA